MSGTSTESIATQRITDHPPIELEESLLGKRERRINAAFPPKLIHPLLESKSRYITLYGGRGGGKSWAIARALLIRAVNSRIRVLCCREYRSAIDDSQHRVLCDQIHYLALDDLFTIERSTIYGRNGSEFRFAGIRNNPDTVRSFEGIDVAWVEEAHSCTRDSWQVLIPTIRKDGSQIIISFNPQLETDETYIRFVLKPPPDSCVVKIGFEDNPWFPPILRAEAEYMKETDPDSYQNVWLGFPRQALEGAVYADEIRRAQEDGRINPHVDYDPLVPVNCFYDIGWRDMTVVILAQKSAGEYRIIDYVEGHRLSIHDYMTILQEKHYVYGTHYMPHDAAAKSLQTGRSIEQLMRSAGRTVHVVPRLPLQAGINAVRTIFPKVWLHSSKCDGLINHLRHYSYDMEHKATAIPRHDEHSHAADALRLLALSLSDAKQTFKVPERHFEPRPNGWMM